MQYQQPQIFDRFLSVFYIEGAGLTDKDLTTISIFWLNIACRNVHDELVKIRHDLPKVLSFLNRILSFYDRKKFPAQAQIIEEIQIKVAVEKRRLYQLQHCNPCT